MRVVRAPAKLASCEGARVEDEAVLVDKLVGIELVGENELPGEHVS